MKTGTRNEFIINLNYIKSVNFDDGKMLDFMSNAHTNVFLYDEIGEQYY